MGFGDALVALQPCDGDAGIASELVSSMAGAEGEATRTRRIGELLRCSLTQSYAAYADLRDIDGWLGAAAAASVVSGGPRTTGTVGPRKLRPEGVRLSAGLGERPPSASFGEVASNCHGRG